MGDWCEKCGERRGTPRNTSVEYGEFAKKIGLRQRTNVTTCLCDVCYDPGYEVDLEEYRRGDR